MATNIPKSEALDYTNVPPESDGRSFYTPPPGWVQPPAGEPIPPITGVTAAEYEAEVRRQLLPHEEFWKKFANSPGLKKFKSEKAAPVKAFIDSVLTINTNDQWPTLDDCIPKGSILDVVDKYFWDNTDIPRELAFFNVLHYVLAKLRQDGVVIHKDSQIILPDPWTIVLAPSGAGKSMTQKALASAMGGQVDLFPDSKSSLQFLTALRDSRLGLYLKDEFAQFLKSVAQDSGMSSVRDYLLRTYDNGDIEHATTTSNVSVESSCIGILGYSPVATLTKYLTREMLLDGFAQRFSFCIAERDNREIVGDYDFSGLSSVVSPLWAQISGAAFHPVYEVQDEGKSAYDRVAQIIISRARKEGIDDSFSRRLAFTSYKYGLLYHVLAGKRSNVIDADDLAWGSKLTALHLLHLRKVFDLYAMPSEDLSSPSAPVLMKSASKPAQTPTPTPTPTPTAVLVAASSASPKSGGNKKTLTHAECVALAKKKVLDFAAKGKKADARSLGAYVKVDASVLRTILADLSTDPALAPHIVLPKTK